MVDVDHQTLQLNNKIRSLSRNDEFVNSVVCKHTIIVIIVRIERLNANSIIYY